MKQEESIRVCHRDMLSDSHKRHFTKILTLLTVADWVREMIFAVSSLILATIIAVSAKVCLECIVSVAGGECIGRQIDICERVQMGILSDNY